MKNVSEAQLNANRENAQHSTGPTSETGRAKVKMNSIVHGFAGQTCLVAEHEQEAYERHFRDLRAEFKPQTPSERFLVQSLAELSFSAQQIRAQIHNFIALAGAKPCAIANSGQINIDYSINQSAALDQILPKINLLGIYEQRKMRMFHNTRRELVQIQAERKAAEKEELEAAAHYRQTSPTTWQPSSDGFACSVEQIDSFITRRDRLKTAIDGQKMAA